MEKIRIDCLIFGYRKINVNDTDKATSMLFRCGVSSSHSPDGTIIVRERDSEKVFLLFDGKLEYKASDTLGLYGELKRIKNKAVCVTALVIILLLSIISQNVIWDIRVEGNDAVSDSEIVYMLQKCGFSVGDLWWGMDCSEIENRLLYEFSKISWININRRGAVAYVKLIEKEGTEKEENPISRYSNIVASEDCIIEEITVKSGVAVVKVGDVVKKGDLLISGALPLESGGGFCVASGEVIGRVADRICVEIPRIISDKSKKKEKLIEATINFFDFSLNIFKKYGNLENECDIIEEKETVSLYGRKKLPISLTRRYVQEYEIVEKIYSDPEITAVAGRQLTARLLSRLVNADLLKIKTSGGFTESGYRTYSDFIFCADVGSALDYEIE